MGVKNEYKLLIGILVLKTGINRTVPRPLENSKYPPICISGKTSGRILKERCVVDMLLLILCLLLLTVPGTVRKGSPHPKYGPLQI